MDGELRELMGVAPYHWLFGKVRDKSQTSAVLHFKYGSSTQKYNWFSDHRNDKAKQKKKRKTEYNILSSKLRSRVAGVVSTMKGRYSEGSNMIDFLFFLFVFG